KFFVAFVALVAVAVANPVTKPVISDADDIQAIVAAIQSPSTDPATAQLLEDMLAEIIGATDNISIGPAIIEAPEPVSIGPAINDFPIPEAPVQPIAPIQPSPVVIGDIPVGSPAPLVQIIVNVNQASDNVVAPAPAVVPEVIQADPVVVVDNPVPVDPVIIVTPEIPEVIEVEPVDVVEIAPVEIEPVIIGTPIIPS
ncbi:hypothetical protein H4F44_23270, partial [Escherichia coli]|uniref:hypothetical protein n=1 Tax=Escherichia coli TaxID=562 RepID=UPI00197CB5B2